MVFLTLELFPFRIGESGDVGFERREDFNPLGLDPLGRLAALLRSLKAFIF